MYADDLNCPLCSCPYDEKSKLPRMIIECGHTFCDECLQVFLNCNDPEIWKCPEDGKQLSQKVENLQINMALVKMIKKAKIKKEMNTPQNACSVHISGIIPKQTSFPDYYVTQASNQISSTNPFNLSSTPSSSFRRSHAEIDSTRNQITRASCASQNCGGNVSEFTLCESNRRETGTFSSVAHVCQIHKRPLEIVCMDHKVKICTSCALFGDHKNHNIKSEEEIMKEFSMKAEILIEFYEVIDKRSEKFENNLKSKQNDFGDIREKLKEVGENAKKKVQSFFKELRFILKTTEKEFVETIEQKYDRVIAEKFAYIEKLPQEIRSHIETWKKNVQDCLDKLNEMNESNEIFFEFLTRTDHLTQAEAIIEEIDTAIEKCEAQILRLNQQIEVDCNFDEFNHIYNSLCKIHFEQSEDQCVGHRENLQNLIHSSGNDKNNQKESLSGIMHKTTSAINVIPCNENKLIDIGGTGSHMKTETSNSNKQEISLPNSNSITNLLVAEDTSFGSVCDENLINYARISRNSFQVKKQSLESNTLTNNISQTSIGKSRKGSQSSTLGSDYIVFIKNQLKNEVANCGGYLIGDEGAKLISDILLSSQYSCSPSKKNCTSKVKELKLSKCAIGDNGVGHLISALEKNSQITTLNLSRNKLKDESYSNIITLIRNNKQLKILNLSHNNFSQVVKEKFKANAKNLNPGLKLDI